MIDTLGDPLFSESWPYSCLSVRCPLDSLHLTNLIEPLGLITRPSQLIGGLHIVANERSAGEHKHQAVRLFVAALKLDSLQHAHGLVLHEVSRLHEHLARSVGRDATPYTACGQANRLLPASGSLAICPATQMHLCQAGFPFRPLEFILRMNRTCAVSLRVRFLAVSPESVAIGSTLW